MKRETITFEPNPVAKKLLKKAIRKMGNHRGDKTKIINRSLLENLKQFASKRDLAKLKSA